MSSKHAFVVCLLALLLAACVSPSTAAVTPAASALPPAPTRTPAPTASPTPQPITVSEIGLTTPALQTAFKGAEQGIVKEGNQYIVTAVSFDLEGKPVENKYTIDIKTFDDHAAIKNKYRPATVQATDADGNQVTLIWDSDHKAWHTPFNMVDNSKFDHVDEIPEVPQGYEKLAVQSALLYFQDHEPFNEKAVFKGNALNMFYETDGSINVRLLSTAIKDKPNQEASTMKASDLWVRKTINGKEYFMPLVVILDPADPNNPKIDEFKILFGYTPINDALANIDDLAPNQLQFLIDSYYKQGAKFVFPNMVVYGNKKFLENNPAMAEFLRLPKNDPSKFSYWETDITNKTERLGPDKTDSGAILSEPGVDYSAPLPDEIQLMILYMTLASR